MERKAFEKAWQNAFQDKEKQPPRHIWNALAAQLAQQEAGRLRRRFIFIQWLAAASVVFAMSIAFWEIRQPGGEQPLTATRKSIQNPIQAQAEKQTRPTTPNPQAVLPDRANELRTAIGNEESQLYQQPVLTQPVAANTTTSAPQTRSTTFGQRAIAFLQQQHTTNLSVPLVPAGADPSAGLVVSATTESATVSPAAQQPIVTTTENPASVPLLPDLLADGETFDKETKSSEPLWASVGFAGGGFNAGLAASGPALLATSGPLGNLSATSQQPESRQQQAGTAFSFGVSVGKSISRKWVVHTGLVYLQQSLVYTSNIVSRETNATATRVFLAESLTAGSTGTDLVLTTPYELRANVNYLSVPVMAGYLVLDRTFSIQLNGGVATDFLVQSAWQDRSGQFQDNPQSASGVYRPINWAGLFNTEFAYRLGKHYRAALVPGFRYSVQPLYQSEINSQLRPFIWDIGFRLKYQF